MMQNNLIILSQLVPQFHAICMQLIYIATQHIYIIIYYIIYIAQLYFFIGQLLSYKYTVCTYQQYNNINDTYIYEYIIDDGIFKLLASCLQSYSAQAVRSMYFISCEYIPTVPTYVPSTQQIVPISRQYIRMGRYYYLNVDDSILPHVQLPPQSIVRNN